LRDEVHHDDLKELRVERLKKTQHLPVLARKRLDPKNDFSPEVAGQARKGILCPEEL
jgi:hypothetical protein